MIGSVYVLKIKRRKFVKVLGIVCSPRKGGNTEIMVNEALAGAKSYGAETELWTTAGKDLKPCLACEKCKKRDGKCVQKDDMQGLFPKILAADGLIFGSPSYFCTVTAQAKIVLDRLFSLYNAYKLAGKIAGVVVVGGSQGVSLTRTILALFIDRNHMIMADEVWGYAYEKGDIKKDEFAMKGSFELGKEIALLIKQGFRWPEEYRRPVYRLCREVYGIDIVSKVAPEHYVPVGPPKDTTTDRPLKES